MLKISMSSVTFRAEVIMLSAFLLTIATSGWEFSPWFYYLYNLEFGPV